MTIDMCVDYGSDRSHYGQIDARDVAGDDSRNFSRDQ